MALRHRLIVVFVCIGLAACARRADDTVRDFFVALDRGDSDLALASFSAELRQKFSDETLRTEAGRWTEVMRQHGGLDDIGLDGGVVTYNVLAYYRVTLLFHDGETRSLGVTLSYVEGTWYINAAV